MTFIEHLGKSGVNLGYKIAILRGSPREKFDINATHAHIGRVAIGLPDSLDGTEHAEEFDERYDVFICTEDNYGHKQGYIFSTLDGGSVYVASAGGLIIDNPTHRILLTQDEAMFALAESMLLREQGTAMC